MSDATRTGGIPARRAVIRWAFRLFRRDWRQHLLIILLLTFTVTAGVAFACAAYNIAPATGRADYGDGNAFFRFDKLSVQRPGPTPDPSTLTAKLDAGTAHFGAIDPIGHRTVPVPGSVKQLDYRSQQAGGPFSAPLLELRSGRYPASDNEAAVTDWVADTLGTGIGLTVDLDGIARTVVGIVENPSDFSDEFVLLPLSQISSSEYVNMLVNAGHGQVDSFRPPGDSGRIISNRSGVPEDLIAAFVIIVVSTIVLFLVALIAAASFTVIAQRRLPQLGMMSAMGATEKHLRFTMVATGAVTGVVASVLGAGVGLITWLVIAPRMEGAVGYRIDAFNIPWWLLIVTVGLAVAASTLAAWWPGRAMSRIPTVAALSGRPPEPARLHRSALVAAAFLVAGVVCLVIGSKSTHGPSNLHVVLIIVGTVAVLAGVLLVGPIAIRALASIAARVPIAARLALRDLSRYQARSGAALAAIALALGIPVAVVATTAAAENHLGLGNLAVSQLIVHADSADGPFVPSAATIAHVQPGVEAIGEALQTPAIQLDAALDPAVEAPPDLEGLPAITIGRPIDRGWEDVGVAYVASPELLATYGLPPDALEGGDIVTSLGDTSLDILQVSPKQSGSRDNDVEHLEAPNSLPAHYTSLPMVLVNPARLAERGWEAAPSGQWLLQTSKPLGSSELEQARIIAAQYGLTIESRETPQSLANVRLGAVGIGMILALGILAMTIGLIRSESAGELRTLTATGATSSTRRNITATTAGGLAGLGAILGIAGTYIALTAGHVSDLMPLPLFSLLAIAVGTPLVAALVGWLAAGREPAVLARRPSV